MLRIQAEFVDGFGALAELEPAVSMFGSARTSEDSPYYKAARACAQEVARHGIAVITGGGPGIMEAANRGAAEVGGTSVGLGIELPHEQSLNNWINLGMNFRYFFVRKTMFMKCCLGPATGRVSSTGSVGPCSPRATSRQRTSTSSR